MGWRKRPYHLAQLSFCFLCLLGAWWVLRDLSHLCSIPHPQQTLWPINCFPAGLCAPLIWSTALSLPSLFRDREENRVVPCDPSPRRCWAAHQALSRLLGLHLLPLLTASYLSTRFPRYAHWFPKLILVFFPMEGVSWDLSLHLRGLRSSQDYGSQRVTDLVRKICRFIVRRLFLLTTSGALRARMSLPGAVWEHREVMPKAHSCVCRDRRSAELLGQVFVSTPGASKLWLNHPG